MGIRPQTCIVPITLNIPHHLLPAVQVPSVEPCSVKDCKVEGQPKGQNKQTEYKIA